MTSLGESRCGRDATEIHHMLTRARGGEQLDEFTTYHLIHLCSECHRVAVGSQGYESGMLIDGYVTFDRLTGRLVYTGTDEFLSKYFPVNGVPAEIEEDDEHWFY